MALLSDISRVGWRCVGAKNKFPIPNPIFGAGEHIALGAALRSRAEKELEAAADRMVDIIFRGAGAATTSAEPSGLAKISAKIDQVLAKIDSSVANP